MVKGRVCTKEEEGVFIIEGRERRGALFHNKQLTKKYFRLPKLSQTILVFFVKE